MAQPFVLHRNTAEWLALLTGLSPEACADFIAAEDGRLAAGVMEPADQLYAAMAAWHSLGAADTVERIFRELGAFLTGISGEKGGWLSSPLRRLKDYIRETDEEAAIPDETVRQLDRALLAAETYQQRMTVLDAAHAGALEAYTAWREALAQHAAGGAGQDISGLPDAIRRSTEFRHVQQQLALTVRLQLQVVRQMAAEVRHVAALAGSMAQNKAAAGRLQAYLGSRR